MRRQNLPKHMRIVDSLQDLGPAVADPRLCNLALFPRRRNPVWETAFEQIVRVYGVETKHDIVLDNLSPSDASRRIIRKVSRLVPNFPALNDIRDLTEYYCSLRNGRSRPFWSRLSIGADKEPNGGRQPHRDTDDYPPSKNRAKSTLLTTYYPPPPRRAGTRCYANVDVCSGNGGDIEVVKGSQPLIVPTNWVSMLSANAKYGLVHSISPGLRIVFILADFVAFEK